MDIKKIPKLRIRRVILILLIGVIIGGVLYYVLNPKKALKFVLPAVSEINYIHVDLSRDSIVTELYVTVQNKMPYKITIDTVHFEIKINDNKAAEETLAVGVALSFRESDTLKVPINFSKTGIKKMKNSITTDSVDLIANFYVVYNTIFGKQKVYHTKEERIIAPQLPEIKVLNVKGGNISLRNKTVDASIKLQITNRGKYVDLELDDLEYNLRVKDVLETKGVYNKTVRVKPASTTTIDVPIVINYDTPVKTLWKIITDNDDSAYKLNIRTNVKVKNFEKINIIPLELDAEGIMELVK